MAKLTGTSVASVTLTGGYINPTGASGLGGVSFIGSYAQLVRMTEDATCIIKGSSYISVIHNDPTVGLTTACTATGIDPNAVIVMPSFHPQKLFGVNAAQNYLYCGGQSWTNNNAYTASANAILGTGGTVSSATMTAYGAGYTSIPQVVFTPAPAPCCSSRHRGNTDRKRATLGIAGDRGRLTVGGSAARARGSAAAAG